MASPAAGGMTPKPSLLYLAMTRSWDPMPVAHRPHMKLRDPTPAAAVSTPAYVLACWCIRSNKVSSLRTAAMSSADNGVQNTQAL